MLQRPNQLSVLDGRSLQYEPRIVTPWRFVFVTPATARIDIKDYLLGTIEARDLQSQLKISIYQNRQVADQHQTVL